MSKYDQFIFKSYMFNESTKTVRLTYAYDDALSFTESYRFDFDFASYDKTALDRALQHLFFVAGVSYYKAYTPLNISVAAGKIDQAAATFYNQTYQKGLGEFFYVNKLDPRTPVNFPVNANTVPLVTARPSQGMLVGVGGGKDSLVSIELLRAKFPDIVTWSLGHREQLTPLVERIGLPHYWVERTIDRQIIALNQADALNGHIPISAIFACVSTVVAVLSGKRDAIVSNEQSANEPTLTYDGVSINHQYSKSQAFESSYQALLQHAFGDSQRYYSTLRPLSELKIAELFSQIGFDKYHDVFSSCNSAFRQDEHHLFWDGTCPKCAFVFLALTPFVGRQELETLFSGKNLLLDPALSKTYENLLGTVGDKPLECVGEIKESRAAMRLTQKQYPELVYKYELPDSYDYKQMMPHNMPADIAESLLASFSSSNDVLEQRANS
jgi:hypothetical protein